MAAMKNGVYVMLAVIVGVMLVGMLPGQISNLAAPMMNRTISLQTGGVDSSRNITTTNTTGLITQPTFNNTSGDIAKTATEAGTKTDTGTTTGGNIDYSFSYALRVSANDPYVDKIYYGLWGAGLIAAVLIYFVSRRILLG